MRARSSGVIAFSTLFAAACGGPTAPEEALYPIVEGIYNVETVLVSSTCRLEARDGARVYVFFQEGRTVQFRPPSFPEPGRVELRDLGIQGELERDGAFVLRGTYVLEGSGNSDDLIVGFVMEGRFDGNRLEGVERHLASFPGGSCEVVFSFAGEEV